VQQPLIIERSEQRCDRQHHRKHNRHPPKQLKLRMHRSRPPIARCCYIKLAQLHLLRNIDKANGKPAIDATTAIPRMWRNETSAP
jgi:hypothetical protein